MRINSIIVPLAVAFLTVLALGRPASANILINVNKSTQRMTVVVDGRPLYTWPVSTGRPGYDTPNGTFRAFRTDINHHSTVYDNAPMPYSIFFTMTGDAVHGTYDRGLGHPVSHGCVRLSVKHAAILWNLVMREKLTSTIVQVSGSIRNVGAPVVANAAPVPPNNVAPWQSRSRDGQGRRRPLFPFFPFSR